ncbi:MAG: formylglycine-generating enzyme family protein [Desulfatibacillaceae bacterium]
MKSTPVFLVALLAVALAFPGMSLSGDEPPPTHENRFGMRFVYIEPGGFHMGSPPAERHRDRNEHLHAVWITRGFYMQTTEVTQGQWIALMGEAPFRFEDCGLDCPAERVRLTEVREYVDLLNGRTEKGAYRLPTEAEWEYACRAGATTPYYWGDEPDCDMANFGNSWVVGLCKGANPGRPARVGSYPPNPWGLYDMAGNVSEWVSDVYALYSREPVTDPTGPVRGPYHVVRGGAWDDPGYLCRCAARDPRSGTGRSGARGFRLVWTPDRPLPRLDRH